MKVTTQLAWGFGSILLLLAIIGGFAAREFSNINEDLAFLHEKVIPSTQWGHDMIDQMNVAARVFLRDFYDLLSDYRFFRLDTRRLIPLGPYQPRNEIFQFQNLLAVRAAGLPAKEQP